MSWLLKLLTIRCSVIATYKPKAGMLPKILLQYDQFERFLLLSVAYLQTVTNEEAFQGRSWCRFVASFLASLSPVSLEKMSLSHLHVIVASQNVALFSQSLSDVDVLKKDYRFILRSYRPSVRSLGRPHLIISYNLLLTLK